MSYKRVGLQVEALFTDTGRVMPKRIYSEGRQFPIEQVLRVRRFTPTEVPCVSPTEYAVVVGGKEKRIYYEPLSGLWFSVKEGR